MSENHPVRMEEEQYAGEPVVRVVVPDGVTEIGAGAFMECAALTEVILPDSLKVIEEGAFYGCEALHKIRLPEGLRRIGSLAFSKSGLEEIRIPAKVEEIGEMAFWECSDLRTADVLGRDTLIEKDAFGASPCLAEGYIAPGYPGVDSMSSDLIFTLLLFTCPDRHTEEHVKRAETFFRENEARVMEEIIARGIRKALANVPLSRDRIPAYAEMCRKYPDRKELLLMLLAGSRAKEDEFIL